MRTITNFNEDWLFQLADGSFADPQMNDADWRTLRLPHDWGTEYAPDENATTKGGGGFATAGIGWYRKHFTAPENLADSQVFVWFDGIYMDSTIYLNGQKLYHQGYGYSSFQVDLTDYLVPGDNVLAVCVDNSHQPNSRWYTGSGIYRNVWLVQTSKVHVAYNGVRCATNAIFPDLDQATLQIRANLTNDGSEPAHAGITYKLYDSEGEMVCASGTALYLLPGETSDCMVRPIVPHPHLWTDEDPYLYTLVATVVVDEQPVDEVTIRTGIRTATFDCDKGFLLNGQQVKIKGMCVHHDCGLTGSVGYKETWRRRMLTLRDMGCNGLRCAHNPPTPEFLDLCDELGFLVMDEIYDEWMLSKDKVYNYYSQAPTYGASQFFKTHAEEELVRMLHRDFNHPSVILWSIGNEVPEQSAIDGAKIMHFLQDICHREDSSRMVTAACDMIAAPPDIRTLPDFVNGLDVVGYNYVARWRERAETFYDEDRQAFPKRRMIGSENDSVGGVRGNYAKKEMMFGGHFGDYSNATMKHEALWRYTVSHDFVAGDYLWTGIDYLGETWWPSRGAGSAPIDTAGFRKDGFYYFRSIWNQKDITLHLVPHWNWAGEEGTFKPVICYTNCDEVKLYLNDRLVGTQGYTCPRYGFKNRWGDDRKVHPTTNDLHLQWTVPYEPGTLRAEGYRDGEKVAETIIETTGAPTRLVAEPDSTTLQKAGIAQIELSTRDAAGRYVPDATPTISCKVEGPAHLVGMDAGNLRDLTVWSAPQRDMFAGLLLAVIQADGPGQVKVTFSAEGMPDEVVEIQVEA